MTTVSTEPSVSCASDASALERVRYYPRQLLTADDMAAEQDYLCQKMRRHNRLLHGWGVVCGMEVKPSQEEGQPWRVRVCPGYAVAPQGDEIRLAEAVTLDLATGAPSTPDPCADAWPCPPTGTMLGGNGKEPTYVYVAVRYAECPARPERVLPAGCGCDETRCETSRIRDSFELTVLWELPASHKAAAAADAEWARRFRLWLQLGREASEPPPVPPCPACPEEPWVVLARVRLPQDREAQLVPGQITYHGRRALYSTSALQALHTLL
jgi:hypothetical protein